MASFFFSSYWLKEAYVRRDISIWRPLMNLLFHQTEIDGESRHLHKEMKHFLIDSRMMT